MGSYTKPCARCGVKFWTATKRTRFCSLTCSRADQTERDYQRKVARWKAGEITGYNGKKYVAVAPFVRRYLFERAGGACEECGWNTPHPDSGKPPLEVHHRDGNVLNNAEENLQLLCPNCHALTPNHGARNKASANSLASIRGYRSLEYLSGR